ncbi:MAG TPA: hypothetical protein VLC71_08195 [Thermomonas sp.]|nr:hypothetical protein [Thermomonas sp.]
MNAETKRASEPPTSVRYGLELNKWVCDTEMREALWEAQSILRLAGEALDDERDREVAQQAVLGAERLLVAQIRRTGWEGMGNRWNRDEEADSQLEQPAHVEVES